MAAVLQRHSLQVVAVSTTARQGSFRVAPRLQLFAVVHSHHHFMQRHACSALRKVNMDACLEGIAPMHGEQCRRAADDGPNIGPHLPRRHDECSRCNVSSILLAWDLRSHKYAVPRCRWDLDLRWSLDNYIFGSIIDSVNILAWALDKVIKECLGDPLSPQVITQVLETNVWNSTLKLSAALSSKPVQVLFDDRAHRVLPIALGNLVNGSWKVAGVYDPMKKQFTERFEIIRWPKTGKAAPRFWASCKLGERLMSPPGELQQCVPCNAGTYSVGGQSTVCTECDPGGSADSSDSVNAVASVRQA